MQEPRLRYLTYGDRQYPVHHSVLDVRRNWEFQAVVKGRIAPRLVDGPAAFRALTLWVLAPDCPHDWVSPPEEWSQVVVMHFLSVDEVLARYVNERGGVLAVDLTEYDADKLVGAYHELLPCYRRPHELAHLQVRRWQDWLTLLSLEGAGYQPKTVAEDLDQERVEAALYWYEHQVSRAPSVKEVASAIGVSEVHLRRLFAQQRGESPRVAFQRLLLQQATKLLRETDLTLEEIADQCGYVNASSFSRAFKAVTGQAPGRFRR